jgi:hypothetical protein
LQCAPALLPGSGKQQPRRLRYTSAIAGKIYNERSIRFMPEIMSEDDNFENDGFEEDFEEDEDEFGDEDDNE